MCFRRCCIGASMYISFIPRVSPGDEQERKSMRFLACQKALGRARRTRDSHARASCVATRVSRGWRVTYSDDRGQSCRPFRRLLAASRDVSRTCVCALLYPSLPHSLSKRDFLRLTYTNCMDGRIAFLSILPYVPYSSRCIIKTYLI